MSYEINVSKNGLHLFATDKRSCDTKHNMKIVLMEIVFRFPEKEGFEIVVSEINDTRTSMSAKRALR